MMTIDDYTEEIWKPIRGYDNIYEVSNLGRVRRIANIDKNNEIIKLRKERIIKPFLRKDGYLSVSLSIHGKVEKKLLHRLVAEAFLQNPDNLPIINHKDEIRTNDNVDNLEWCTYSYNITYGNARVKWLSKVINGTKSKPVCQFDKDGNLIKEYPSAHEAARQLNITVSGIISCCLNYKKYNKCGGYLWKYKNDLKDIIAVKRIFQMTKEGIILNAYYGITEAEKKTGILRTAIANCLAKRSKSAGGYLWKMED